MTTLHLDTLDTPIGTLALVVDGEGHLCACGFTSDHARMGEALASRGSTLKRSANPGGVTTALCAYFEGDVAVVGALPVRCDGTTFQQRVWTALRCIPAGRTWTYSQLARHIGQPGAARAVGRANAHNPIAIVVPCHRVIGGNGTLTGYAGGIERKRWLLAHERGRSTRELGSDRPGGDSLVGGRFADALGA